MSRSFLGCILFGAIGCSGAPGANSAVQSGHAATGGNSQGNGGNGAAEQQAGTGGRQNRGGAGGRDDGAGGSNSSSSEGGASTSDAGEDSGGAPETGGPTDVGVGGSDQAGCARWSRNVWRPVATLKAPSPREEAWVLPTAGGMIVFGGYLHGTSNDPFLDDGAFYDLCRDEWTPMSVTGVPHGITDTVAIRPSGHWTGTDLLVWGGVIPSLQSASYIEGSSVSFAARYNRSRDSWSPLQRDGEPSAREYDVHVWTGERLLVWGGVAQSGDKSWANHNDGALYDPATDLWLPMSEAGAPSGRMASESYVWTGQQLIVWGGLEFDPGPGFAPTYKGLTDGAVYSPADNRWTPMPTGGAPKAQASLVWTGKKMIALSMLDGYTTPGQVAFDGALYDPKLDQWSAMSAPDGSLAATLEQGQRRLVWTGKVMATFGVKVVQGTGTPALLLYDPERNDWSSAEVPRTPFYNSWQSVFAVDGKVLVVGPGTATKDSRGADHQSTLVALFDPESGLWAELPLLENRSRPTVISQSGHLIAYGGKDIYTDLDAPNPCTGATGPCDPITPTIQKLLNDAVAIAF